MAEVVNINAIGEDGGAPEVHPVEPEEVEGKDVLELVVLTGILVTGTAAVVARKPATKPPCRFAETGAVPGKFSAVWEDRARSSILFLLARVSGSGIGA